MDDTKEFLEINDEIHRAINSVLLKKQYPIVNCITCLITLSIQQFKMNVDDLDKFKELVEVLWNVVKEVQEQMGKKE